MYKLVARDSRGRVVSSVELSHGVLAIGRGQECAVVLPSTAVSRRHALIRLRDDGRAIISDEGSANGVKVNGQFISAPTAVNDSSDIRISDFVLQLEVPEDADTDQRPAARQMIAEEDPEDPTGRVGPAAALERPREEMDEDLDTCLEPFAGAAVVLAASRLELRARGGPYDGNVFRLDKPLLGVGRAPDSDIVLDDPSISRRHAQLRVALSGQTFTVVDLRSSNGTFIDGKRIKRAECGLGSVVRFGDLPFSVSLRRDQSRAHEKRGSRRVIWAAGGITLVLVGAGVFGYLRRPRPPNVVALSPEQRLREIQAQAQRLVEEARDRMLLREWTSAVQLLDQAKAKDPLNPELARLRQTAMDELQAEAIFKKGMEYFDLGNRENFAKAREVFLKVPESSAYRRDVRYKLRTIDENLAEDLRIEGVSRCQHRYWAECQQALCQFFEKVPEESVINGESRLRTMLAQAEKRIARSRSFKPCQARRYVAGTGRGPEASDPLALLEQKYESTEVREILTAYLEGKLDQALKRLADVQSSKAARPQLDALREVNRQLLIIKGKYQEGYSAYRERDVAQAQRHWDVLLSADSALMPNSVESFFRREVTRALGDLYFELGDEKFKAGRLRPCFALWSRGKLADARHERLLNGLLQLEKEAERLLRDGQRLIAAGDTADGKTKLQLARDITDESRPTHEEAAKALAAP